VAFHTRAHPIKHLKDVVFDILKGLKWLHSSRGDLQQTQTSSPLESTLIQPHHTGTGQEWVSWGTPWSGIMRRAMQAQARIPYTISQPPICAALSRTDNQPLSPIEAERRV
jgi:hypothetical protein